ncbi:MAG: hypothetical protein JWQ35_2485 [Bacteriovoracaceae bacterium]|nr:hypothetical protein [Bacteriovoracaceae bacterium]
MLVNTILLGILTTAKIFDVYDEPKCHSLIARLGGWTANQKVLEDSVLNIPPNLKNLFSNDFGNSSLADANIVLFLERHSQDRAPIISLIDHLSRPGDIFLIEGLAYNTEATNEILEKYSTGFSALHPKLKIDGMDDVGLHYVAMEFIKMAQADGDAVNRIVSRVLAIEQRNEFFTFHIARALQLLKPKGKVFVLMGVGHFFDPHFLLPFLLSQKFITVARNEIAKKSYERLKEQYSKWIAGSLSNRMDEFLRVLQQYISLADVFRSEVEQKKGLKLGIPKN